MKEYTTTELFRLTRDELMRLDYRMAVAIARLPILCEDRTVALINQRRVRRELGRREYSFELDL